MGGSSAPKADKNIGIAAAKSAQTGADMLAWMKERSVTTDAWANEDRARFKTTFQPLQDQMIQDAKTWDSAPRREARAEAATADVRMAAGQQAAQRRRQAMAMGVDPRSGAYQAGESKGATDTALASAGAANMARRAVGAEAEAKRAAVVNLGQGYAVNPATSFGMGSNAVQAGGAAAMQGYGQQGSLLNADHQNRMQAWQAGQNNLAGIGGALGSIGGALLANPVASAAIFSDENAKENRRPARGALKAVEAMPVDQWSYKDDPAATPHVGAMAQDFQAATGKGDGRSIPVVDAIGVTMKAVQELSAKVDHLAGRRGRGAPPPARLAA